MKTKGAPQTDSFAGWPKPALTFLRGLKKDNSKTYFEANRETYEKACREPLVALVSELERELGGEWDSKIFRLNRDLRFSKDKRPYKEQISAVFSSSKHAGGYYLQLSHEALYVGAGSYEMGADQLTRYREAVAGKPGEKLAGILAKLKKDGYGTSEPTFKRVPAGYPPDHPREELLRASSAWANRTFKPAPWFHTREALTRIRDSWRNAAPLRDWVDKYVGPSTEPMRHR
jgi:uncharacterized protein (TIGR02453 family)